MTQSFFDRIENLPPEKRELFERFVKKERLDPKTLADFVAPRNHEEQVLAGIWAEVLGIERVGVHDNYFELGGDSILIIHIVTKAGQEGLYINTHQLFDYPTVAQLAAVAQSKSHAPHSSAPDSDAGTGDGGSRFPLAGIPADQLQRLLDRLPRVADIYPLTPMQEGILYHSLQAPSSEAYMVQWSARIRGTFHVGFFERAWRAVVSRHPVLRTGFHWVDLDQPMQVVQETVETRIQQEDWRNRSATDQKQALSKILEQDRKRDFDLGLAPLTRITFLRLSEETYHCVWTHHHLILDGWSQQAVLEEVFAYYQSILDGTSPNLKEPLPFREHIGWLQARDSSDSEPFWREALAGFRHPTPLGGTAPSTPAVTGSAPAYRSEVLACSEETSHALKQFCRERQLTLNILIQGAWALLLAHLSGEKDVLFGATVAGRSAALPGVASVVGPLLNTLPVRMIVDPLKDLDAWLKELQGRQSELFRYEHTPLSSIRKWSDIEGDQPLFNSISVFENFQLGFSQNQPNPSLEIEQVEVMVREHYPLILVTIPGERLNLELKYDGHRFGKPQVQLMVAALDSLLKTLHEQPSQPLSNLLSLMTEVVDLRRGQLQAKMRTANSASLKTARRRPTRVSQDAPS